MCIRNFDYRGFIFKTLQEDFGAYGKWNVDERDECIIVDLMVDCNESIVDKPVTDKQKFVLTQLPNLVGDYDERLSNRRGAISKVITLCKLFPDIIFCMRAIKEDDRTLNNSPIIYKRHIKGKKSSPLPQSNTDMNVEQGLFVNQEVMKPMKSEVHT